MEAKESTDIDPINEQKKNLWKDYGLCGYLQKITERSFKGLKYISANKKRWCVYSDKTGKLYLYRNKGDTEPTEEINIALSTFLYDLENNNDKQFTISCGNKYALLEASSNQERLFWLQQLQAARRDFNHRIYFSGEVTGPSMVRPISGLIKTSDVECSPDPYRDLIELMDKPVIHEENHQENRSSLLSSIGLPLNLFRSSSSESPRQMGDSRLTSSSPLTSPGETTPEGNTFEKVGSRIRNSMRIRMTKSATEDSLAPKCVDVLCKKCVKLKYDLETSRGEITKINDCWDASKEAVNILQHQVEVLQHQNTTFKKLDTARSFDCDLLEILREKDDKIVSMESSQLKLKNTLAKLTANLRDSRVHTDSLEEKLSMLTSLVEVKERVIVDVTDQLQRIKLCPDNYDQIGGSKFYTNPSFQSGSYKDQVSVAVQTARSEYDCLTDKLEGYRAQNCFLNKEILDLNLMRKQMHERQNKLMSESSEWEAKFYQIQSKYLLLLNDLHSPHTMDGEGSVVPQLLQDLVESYGSTDLRGVRKRGQDYDEFGFCVNAPPETDLATQATFLQKQSRAFANQTESAKVTATLGSRWESFIASTNSRDIFHHPELKNLIRLGIPYQYKGKIWGILVQNGVRHIRNEKKSSYYQSLLSERISSLDTFAKQIEVDLLRTLPNNRHYESLFSDGISKLRRVLLAYSRHNLEVGYCQGLNRLAAVALIFLNEEEAFWCLVYIVEVLLPPSFYSNDLLGSQVDQRVLKDLIASKLPNLSGHFEKHSLDVSLFTFNWFLCIYVDVIPPSTYLYIWDSFLFEGSKVLFRFALAVFKLCEESIMLKQDYLSIFNYLRSVPQPMLNVQRLGQVAFTWANPLPMKAIRIRRDHHLILVKEELKEVEASRDAFKEEAKRKQDTSAAVKCQQVSIDEPHVLEAPLVSPPVPPLDDVGEQRPPADDDPKSDAMGRRTKDNPDVPKPNGSSEKNSFETVGTPEGARDENWEIVPSQKSAPPPIPSPELPPPPFPPFPQIPHSPIHDSVPELQ